MTLKFPNELVINGNGEWTYKPFRFNIHAINAGKSEPSWKDVILSGVSPLTLINAKADGLNYLKLFGGTELLPSTYLDTVTLSGGCEQRNLPSGHQELTYLQGDGTAYIETDVEPTNNTGMKIVFEYGESGSSAATSGVYDGVLPRQDTFFISTNSGSVSSNTTIFIAHRGDTLLSTDTEVPVIGKTYTALINYMNDGYMGFEGLSQKQLTTLSNVLSNKVLLFARLNYNTDNITASPCKIKYVEFTEGTEVIRKYYPDSYNNMLGLYDTITNTFLTNKNSTGSFTAGSDVTTPTPDTPMDIVSNNGAIKLTPNLLDRSEETQGKYINRATGSIDNTGSPWAVSDYIPVVAGSKITISNITYSSVSAGYNYYNSEKALVSTIPYETGTHTYTVPNNASYIRICYRYDPDDNVRINVGDSANSIYTDGTQELVTDSLGNTASAEMLLAIGSYQDTQEVIAGSVTRNVGIKALDGTENWTQHSSQANIQYFDLLDSLQPQSATAIPSTHYVGTSESNANMPTNSIKITNRSGASSGSVFVKSEYTSADGLKQFLAQQYAQGTPVIIVYPLSSSTTESVTGQFLSKPPVTQTAGSISNLPIAITESSHTTPTPQQPLQINCNNGAIKVSPNLFTRAGETLDKYYNASGVEQNGVYPNYSFAHTDFLKVKPNTTYTFGFKAGYATSSGATLNHRIIGWTSSKSYVREEINVVQQIAAVGTLLYDTFTTSATTEYVTINFVYSPLETELQLVEGSALPATYMPYGQIYADGTTETVEVTGKNLFNKDNTDVSNGYIANTYLDLNGNTVTANNYAVSVYIAVNENTIYYYAINGSNTTITQHNAPRIAFYDGNKEYISSSNAIQYGTSFTTPANCSYLRLPIYKTALQYGVQLEKGSTATTYEPYFNGGTATAENLFKVDSYKDEQEVTAGDVTRKIGVKVLDGTENWTTSSVVTGKFLISTAIVDWGVTRNTVIGYCTHAVFANNSQSATGIVNFDNNSFCFYYSTSSTTLTDFKQFLADQYNAGTPVIIVFPLNTPTTESVTPQSLTIQAGTNTVEITQASIDDLTLEVSYKAGVPVTITEVQNSQLSNNVEVTING